MSRRPDHDNPAIAALEVRNAKDELYFSSNYYIQLKTSQRVYPMTACKPPHVNEGVTPLEGTANLSQFLFC